MVELRDAASVLLEDGARLLVLGGSCMVAVGLCAAMAKRGQRPRLVYIDRHLDLNTPHSTIEGSLSWMGMAHALRLDGTASQLTDAAGPDPLLASADLVYLGVDDTQATDWERSQRQALGISIVPQVDLVASPFDAAHTAITCLPSGPFIVHVDVDVLEFLDAPLAENVNGRNSGPTIEQLQHALRELVHQPGCWGVSIGQLDPAHAASDPDALTRFVAALGLAFATTAT
jgi:arginase